jgi:hypothetical protein
MMWANASDVRRVQHELATCIPVSSSFTSRLAAKVFCYLVLPEMNRAILFARRSLYTKSGRRNDGNVQFDCRFRHCCVTARN